MQRDLGILHSRKLKKEKILYFAIFGMEKIKNQGIINKSWNSKSSFKKYTNSNNNTILIPNSVEPEESMPCD